MFAYSGNRDRRLPIGEREDEDLQLDGGSAVEGVKNGLERDAAAAVFEQGREVVATCARCSGQMGTNRGETGGLPLNQVARPGRLAG